MQTQLGLGVTVPGVLKPTRYRSEMELLHAEARAFRNGPDMLLAEQGVAITRFHRRLVDRARILLEQLRDEWDAWMRASLEPMAAEIQRFKQETEQRLDRLQQLNQSREEAKAQIVALRHEGIRLAKQMTLLRNIRNTLQYQPEALPRQKPGPYLVTRDGQAV
jgi:septal ring factor EnvC (AmiA/AmiB activator)